MMNTCTNCGAQLAAGDQFCGECGTRVESLSSATAQTKPHAPVRSFLIKLGTFVASAIIGLFLSIVVLYKLGITTYDWELHYGIIEFLEPALGDLAFRIVPSIEATVLAIGVCLVFYTLSKWLGRPIFQSLAGFIRFVAPASLIWFLLLVMLF